MKQVFLDRHLSEEEYILFEEKSEVKHELINGKIFEISGSSKFHNAIERKFANLIEKLLLDNSYEIFTEGFKVKTGEMNFFYPDVIVCKKGSEKYYTTEPLLLAEILSDGTRKFDLTDKFIQYRSIASLEYYLCIEPEQTLVILYFKNEKGEWQTETYTKEESTINLLKLNISFQ